MPKSDSQTPGLLVLLKQIHQKKTTSEVGSRPSVSRLGNTHIRVSRVKSLKNGYADGSPAGASGKCYGFELESVKQRLKRMWMLEAHSLDRRKRMRCGGNVGSSWP